MPAKYEIKNNKILKNGHTMFLEDVLSDLKKEKLLRIREVETIRRK